MKGAVYVKGVYYANILLSKYLETFTRMLLTL